MSCCCFLYWRGYDPLSVHQEKRGSSIQPLTNKLVDTLLTHPSVSRHFLLPASKCRQFFSQIRITSLFWCRLPKTSQQKRIFHDIYTRPAFPCCGCLRQFCCISYWWSRVWTGASLPKQLEYLPGPSHRSALPQLEFAYSNRNLPTTGL